MTASLDLSTGVHLLHHCLFLLDHLPVDDLMLLLLLCSTVSTASVLPEEQVDQRLIQGGFKETAENWRRSLVLKVN